jgi:hypothetical protein
MNLNDIQSRLDRALTDLNIRVDDDYKRHVKVELIDKGASYTLPGKENQTTIDSKVLSIIRSLGTLKDHLKECLVAGGHKGQIVEDAINSSLHLQVLVDIYNADKHGGYPLDNPRSKLNPSPKNEKQSLTVVGDLRQAVVMVPPPNSGIELEIKGVNSFVVLTADICSENGQFIFSFDTLVETCYFQLMLIAKQYLSVDTQA